MLELVLESEVGQLFDLVVIIEIVVVSDQLLVGFELLVLLVDLFYAFKFFLVAFD